MKTKSLTSLFAIALALVACNKNETEPAFTPELKLDKTEKISASADGGSVDLKVTANVSWTATSNDETVATVAPASKEITDKKSAETPVTVTISENETTEARTATLTFKAEGCKDIVVEIEQAAGEIPDVFEVLDNTGLQPAPSSFDVAPAGGSVMVYVNSNINWTATSSAATWLTATPASFNAESKDPEPTAVSIKATANTGAARSATITFSAASQQDVVITINQAVAPTLAISFDNITYQSADVTFTSSSKTDVYFYVLTTKATYDNATKQGMSGSDLVKYFLHQNAVSYEMTDIEFLKAVGKTETYTQGYSELIESTEFIALACFFDANADPIGNAASATFTTKAKPAADPEYLANLGTYKFDCYDYFEDDAPVKDAVMELTEGVVNESYKLCIYGIFGPDYTEQMGPEYIDRFYCAWNKADNTIELENDTLGDFGCYWGFTFTTDNCGIFMSMGFEKATVGLQTLVLSPDKSGNLIGSTIPDLVDGDFIWMQASIYTINPQTGDPEDSGYSSACLDFLDGVTFTKDVAPTVKNSVKHSLYEMPRYFKHKKMNGGKAVKSGKLSVL